MYDGRSPWSQRLQVFLSVTVLVYTLMWLWKYNRNSGIKTANTPDRNDDVGTSNVLLHPPVWINEMYIIGATQETTLSCYNRTTDTWCTSWTHYPAYIAIKRVSWLVSITSECVIHITCFRQCLLKAYTRTTNAYRFCSHKFRIGYVIWHLWSVSCLIIIEA